MELLGRVFGKMKILVLLAVVLFLVLTNLRFVNSGEIGILLEFGKVKEVVPPGVYFTLPFFGGFTTLSTQIEKLEVESSAASNDLQVVKTNIALNYQLKSNYEYMWTNFRDEFTTRLMEPLVHESVKAVTAKYTADQLITKRGEVKEIIASDLKKKFQSYGIEVKEFSITNFDFSPEFNQAIEQKVVAEQNRLRTEFELAQTKIEVQKQIAQANATASATILKAQAEADAISIVNDALVKAQSNPDYLKYRYLEKWDGKLPQAVGSSGLFFTYDVNK